jgi:hypothetical protein
MAVARWHSGRLIVTRPVSTDAAWWRGTAVRPLITRYREPVSAARAATVGRIARWILLGCTLFGLAAMHTLGHAGMRMAPGHAGAAVRVAAATMSAAEVPDSGAPSAVGPGECASGHCDGGMSGWGVCQAVLSGLAVTVLLAALLSWAIPTRRANLNTIVVAFAVPRGPPRRSAGLTTASTAVLRI